MTFPLIKLATVAVRQASKPLAAYMQSWAKKKPGFRAVCVNVAYYYRLGEYKTNQTFYEHKAKRMRDMSEEVAVRLGTTLVGEVVLFAVATGALMYEYRKSSQKIQDREKEVDRRIQGAEDQIDQIRSLLEADRRTTPPAKH